MEKRLLNNYLALCVKQQLGLNVDLTDQYDFAENLVSKKNIIAPTFTDKVLSNNELKMFLSSLITELNYEKCSADDIRERLENLQKSHFEEIKKIV
ncbi:MAG: hypothetical protein J6O88_00295 [Chryseobacterium sp.]|uniref:hypothetical protein n=1 Tax=Chryseobacterium sp. TaxID=1871047 RepID=UPI001B00C7EB|nr:hypothetical protein [Chryseobacterium sp.]MBO6183117.1 hypothetical protein [Chryseobacterium sp.]